LKSFIFFYLRLMDSSHSWCPLQYNEDIVVEVLKHLDAKSLAMAGCVNRQWKRAVETENLWEGVYRKHWPAAGESQNMRSVVIALGGYRRFFLVCLRPLLYRSLPTRTCNHDGFIPLSLSLFSMDCYERLGRNKGYLRDDESFMATVGRYRMGI
jgi:F-box protein GID2